MRRRGLFVKVYHSILTSPKVAGLSHAARWTYVTSIVMSGRDTSDGVVKRAVVLAEAGAPPRAASELVKAGLWHEPGHGCPKCPPAPRGHIVVHDYTDWNSSRAAIEEKRKAQSEGGKAGADARWGR